MSEAVSKAAVLEWLDVEIELSSGNDPVLKADRWAFLHVKKAIEVGDFDLPDISELETENRMQAERNKRLEAEVERLKARIAELEDQKGDYFDRDPVDEATAYGVDCRNGRCEF